MYRPPENSNRVKSIKSKFENVQNRNQSIEDDGRWSNVNNINKHNLSRQLSDPSKRNIKRTPAFRIDLHSEKNDCFERKAPHNRSFYFDKIQQFSTTQKNNCDSNKNLINNKVKVLQKNSNGLNEKQNKQERNSKPVLIKSKSSSEFALIRSKFDKNLQEPENNPPNRKPNELVIKNISSLYTEPVPKALRSKIPIKSDNVSDAKGADDNFLAYNEDTENNTTSDIHHAETIKLSQCNRNTKETNFSNGLSDTLKAALKRPLPKGPAPQKPPRTFEHNSLKPLNDMSKNTSFLHQVHVEENKKKAVDNIETDGKHDPRYMLNKLELALRMNKIKTTRKQKKVETTATSGEDSDDSVLFKSKSKKEPLSSPDLLSTSGCSFKFNCLHGLTNNKSTDQLIPEPNSSFFINCRVAEPVYAEPFSTFQETDEINAKKNLANYQKCSNSLYYMSTPLLCDGGKSCIYMNENLNQPDLSDVSPLNKQMLQKEMFTDNSSQSSFASDLDSAVSTPLDEHTSLETTVKIKQLINSFEGKQGSRLGKDDKSQRLYPLSNESNRIEDLKLSLEKTLEKCFESDKKESSDELECSERKISVDSIIKKFQTYVKTMPKYEKSKLDKDDRLFYCCLVVGWDREKPTIRFKFPMNAIIPDRIEDLCYPEAVNGPLDISDNAQCYSLVITNDKGQRTFGYCRRVIPEGSTKCIPLVYCILSERRAPRFYKKILTELESRHGIPDKLRDELISELYHKKFPRPGESIKVNLIKFIDMNNFKKDSEDKNQSDNLLDLTRFVEVTSCGKYGMLNNIKRIGNGRVDLDTPLPSTVVDHATNELILALHHDTRYEEADLKPLHQLPSDILLKIFASLLLERKVILISCVISKLSSCVDALQSILYPFSWPHTFIPILPQCLWDVVESPTPVICGILSVSIVNHHKIENGIVVDLDECDIISAEGDEDNILSDSMKKAWSQSLLLADTIPQEHYVHSVYLSDAYIKVFIVSLKHYKNHIINHTFEKEAFIRNGKTKGIRRFLKWFVETTMFVAFIDAVLTNPDSFTLFDQKIEIYGSEESNLILTKLLEWKK